eukprot:TRINITY_DN12729_c0_g1_i1.p3 TRINITY_DN12729_c0_g1~~TRINITY_DN12729_c0_g1_i1.p3  ORF type:complete len:100 (-),score=6.57 TRINITY_DN12729_c0_g1_i1:498-797(-)
MFTFLRPQTFPLTIDINVKPPCFIVVVVEMKMKWIVFVLCLCYWLGWLPVTVAARTGSIHKGTWIDVGELDGIKQSHFRGLKLASIQPAAFPAFKSRRG